MTKKQKETLINQSLKSLGPYCSNQEFNNSLKMWQNIYKAING